MTFSTESSPPTRDWKFSQVFGEQSPGEEVQDIDVISAIDFEKSGDYLAVGDRGGRVVIFESKAGKNVSGKDYSRSELEQLDFMAMQHPKFQYKTEFQSHEPEFDYLKSLEIEEKINKLRWRDTPNGSVFILSTNNKTIKLWKIKEHKVKKVKEMDLNPFVCSENTLLAEGSFVSGQHKPSLTNGYCLEWTEKMDNRISPSHEDLTKIPNTGDAARARCRKVYAHAHDFNINSISNNSDGETFVSADDLRINLWNLEVSDQCFNIIDMKPLNMDDLTEVITSAEFHPLHCNLLAYSSSRGFIRLVDMRQSAVCDHSARILQDGECRGSKSFFTEIIASISDIKFATDGRHILSRDYMNLKFSDLYNTDAIFDKFDCCVSGDGLDFATGSYSNLLHIFSYGVGGEEAITVEASRSPNRKPHLQAAPRARRSSLSSLSRAFSREGYENASSGNNEFSCNLNSKLLHLAWHPRTNLIACSAGNSLFMYYA
ncbi:serine/threonine protein phosphatase 2A 55 kDa regulatory subunit B beta isoform-like isoform X2 [Cornus florida]|uniref:serine/threonine protein phosphatase 2A 55 kDa regulatory subunit B beta isoform-like isoform X2 n=1 Tax=Cornus florida TaxID=4283 RepID=UPI002897DC66|nr:serine/threonine protein phosphatase 2A 55 kDa regulatory subunit B beta isoform-like isoform X2 [Cornus florida]